MDDDRQVPAAPPEAPAALLPRGLVIVLGCAGTVITVAGIRELSWLLGPVFLALMLVIAVSPVQSALNRRGVPRWVSTISILVILYLVILVLAGVLVVSVAQLAALLPSYSSTASSMGESVTKLLASYGVGAEQINSVLQQIDPNRVADILTTILSSLTSVATTLFFVLALMFFIGLDAAGFPERIAQVFSARPNVATALSSFAGGTRRYLVVSSVFGLICAVLDAIALEILGVPLPLLWAVLAFITNYIPNIGFFVGLVPPALLALLDGTARTGDPQDGLRQMFLTVAAYLLINVVIQTVIQPRFVGNVVGLSVTVTFLALAFWAWALGPLGAILAIPITLLAKALLVDVDPQSRWIDALVGSGEVVDAHGRHLAAEDEDAGTGASDVVAQGAGTEGTGGAPAAT